MAAPYSLIVFDFDGTLVDTLDDIAYHANKVLSDFGYPVQPLKSVRAGIGWGVHELLKSLAPGFGDDEKKLEKAVLQFKEAYRSEPVLQTSPFSNVKEVLSGSLSKVKKAVVTNKPQDITIQILDKLDLSKYFEMVVGMHAGFPAKPDPAALNHVMEKMGFGQDKTIYVGDSHVDGEVSLAAGVDFAWVNYGYHAPKRIIPTYEFSDAREWEDLVR